MIKRSLTALVIIFLAAATLLAAGPGEKLKKEFSAKDKVQLSIVSGDVLILNGTTGKIIVEVKYDVSPADAFEARFHERKNSLQIKEKWYGQHSRGNVLWTVTVPAKTEIKFSSASGDLRAENMRGAIKCNTASGDIELENCAAKVKINTASGDVKAGDLQGTVDISTASGDVELKNCNGEFDVSCASGDIEARGLKISGNGEFSTASGDIDLKLGADLDGDLELSAASGDVDLRFNGTRLADFIEVSASRKKGRIHGNIDFDSAKPVEVHGKTYMRKTFGKKTAGTAVFAESASGDITIKK